MSAKKNLLFRHFSFHICYPGHCFPYFFHIFSREFNMGNFISRRRRRRQISEILIRSVKLIWLIPSPMP